MPGTGRRGLWGCNLEKDEGQMHFGGYNLITKNSENYLETGDCSKGEK